MMSARVEGARASFSSRKTTFSSIVDKTSHSTKRADGFLISIWAQWAIDIRACVCCAFDSLLSLCVCATAGPDDDTERTDNVWCLGRKESEHDVSYTSTKESGRGREKESEWKRKRNWHIYIYIYIYMDMYIYICICMYIRIWFDLLLARLQGHAIHACVYGSTCY